MSNPILRQSEQWPERCAAVPEEHYRQRGVDFEQPVNPEIDYGNRTQDTYHYIQQRYPDIVTPRDKRNPYGYQTHEFNVSYHDDPDTDPDFAPNLPEKYAAWEPDFDEDPRHTDYDHLEQLADYAEGEDAAHEHPPTPDVGFSFQHPGDQDDAYHRPPDLEQHGGYQNEWGGWEVPDHFDSAREHADASIADDEGSGYNWGPPPSPHGDPGFGEEETDDHPDPDHMRDYREAGVALDDGEHLVMRDPGQIDPHSEGHTYPDTPIGGDPEGTVSVRPREQAGPHDAFVMPASESGLGYDAIVRHSPEGTGYDVIKPLDE